MPEPQPFTTRAELCAMLSLHPATIRRYERNGRLTPYAFTGRTVRYRKSEVDSLIEQARSTTKRRPGPKPRAQPAPV